MLDDESKQFVVIIIYISTQKGMFRYTRLLFGIVYSAHGIFQCFTSMLHDIPSIVVYIGDILSTGTSEEAFRNTTSFS